MLTKYVKHRDANLYINAANLLGIDVEMLSSRWGYAVLSHRGNSLLVGREALSCNPMSAFRLSSNKALT